MRFTSLFLCFLFSMPLFAQDTDTSGDAGLFMDGATRSEPSAADSLAKLRLRYFSSRLQKLLDEGPSLRSKRQHMAPLPPDDVSGRENFEKELGIIPAPNPKMVEPNGIVLEGDPSIDLKMIYPKETRERIEKENIDRMYNRKKMPRFKIEPLK